ncbi:SDR family NAD(P)-dependent oxidoreductase [Paenibacillus donghaensis]|uniref:Carrier domain-containing protein n=1 Tax=Paenibacillus donghaensis TaxID=414771 RepID=A0A2Z2KPA2_9BACL|nr:SDR family NAD(P)-dependent oxidoreductase [Paenibacillus donghaensis]ASA20598.1 hypothetical protein B9T62_07185 [Paenibacillus donghaensis]
MGFNLSELSLVQSNETPLINGHRGIGDEDAHNTDIAIIGMSVNFPGAKDCDAYWNNIKNGKDLITEFPETRRAEIDKYLSVNPNALEGYEYFQAAFLDEVDTFDYRFFRLTPAEASLMSPVQRLFLQTAYTTIEDAGYAGSKIIGSKTGVFVGYIGDTVGNTYEDILASSSDALNPGIFTGNLSSMIPSRISYYLDLKGPSLVVDTACSSSLVAVHLACQSIRNGECDTALVGGIKLFLVPVKNKVKLGLDSPTYRSKAFDDSSDGIGVGEGSAAVMLKPLSKALRDRDHIYAVIKGSAINQDGNSIGITAPNVAEQANVIAKAWNNARINPETLSYIEAHGTGTRIGDPIEIEGIKKAFERFTNKKQFCAIGSVKSNIGHLNEAAGIAGLIKLALCLKHGEIPPTLHLNRPNRRIEFEDSPVYVQDKWTKWDFGGEQRRAGISSFGFSGTNCHMVLEQSPEVEAGPEAYRGGPSVLTLSSKSRGSLERLLLDYRTFLSENPAICMKNLCYTANTGRDHFNYRLAIIATELKELKNSIESLCASGLDGLLQENIYFNQFTIVNRTKGALRDGDLTEEQLEGKNCLARFKMKEYVSSGKGNKGLFQEICSLYASGATIDWNLLYDKEKLRTVSLPTYSFDRERCWCSIADQPIDGSQPESGNPFFTMAWEPNALVKGNGTAVSKQIILFKNTTSSYESIEEQLRGTGNLVISVTIGKSFERINTSSYVIDNSEEGFARLFWNVSPDLPVHIVHLLAAGLEAEAQNLNELDRNLELGVYNVFYLAKALKHLETSDPIRVDLIAGRAGKVAAQDDLVIPENGTMIGLAKVINREFPQVSCRTIDVDDTFTVEQLLDELSCENNEGQVAYRNGVRYAEYLQSLQLEATTHSNVEIKENGTYLISGGLSGIGYEVAKYLTAAAKVHLILMNRTSIPEREKWDELIVSNADHKLTGGIAAIRSLEAAGSTVEYLRADVSNLQHMEQAIDRISAKYGKIDGIIHSAGVTDDCLIANQTKEGFDAILRPKVHGTWLLHHLTSKEKLDFFVMFSSVSSIIAAPGQGDYAAANAYLDSFCDYRRINGKPALTINWVAWKETGMALQTGFTMDTIFKALSTKKGMNGFEKVFARDLSRVLIGELNFDNHMAAALLKNTSFSLSEELRSKLTQLNGRKRPVKHEAASMGTKVKLKGKLTNQYSSIEQKVAEICMNVLGYKEIDVYDNFFDLGADSISLTQMFQALDKQFVGRLSLTKVFAYPSISELAQYLSEQDPTYGAGVPAQKLESTDDRDSGVAIIGIGANMPTGTDLDVFWEHLRSGKDMIGPIPDNRKKDIDAYLQFLGKEAGEADFMEAAYLDDIDMFDYKFFKLSPKEASLMDPNQRKFLQTAWAAIEDAGYGGHQLKNTQTGVFVGFSNHPLNSYIDLIAETSPEDLTVALAGNLTSIIPSRVSYLLDLKGPSILVDTACSSSLVAVHMACQSLLSGECNTALVGGVKINIIPLANELKIGIESSTARTRAFDDDSDGTGIGEGVICIVLKPLSRALNDHDHIYGVIKGSAVNQDGASVGITAPNVKAQTEVILQAWKNSKIDPATLSYIEAHGTGTKLGDPIEIEAVNEAFRQYTDKKNFCAVSTVKSNMGHLYEAAGLAGLVKAVMSLQHRTLAPSIHYSQPNQAINFADSALFINNRLKQWEVDSVPRRCGISSFGFSGTNCHVVLEEAPVITATDIKTNSQPQIITLTAKTETALLELMRSYENFLDKPDPVRLNDVCKTVNTGRVHHPYRLAFIVKDTKELLYNIKAVLRKGLYEEMEQAVFYGKHSLLQDKAFRDSLSLEAGLLVEQLEKVPMFNEEGLELLCTHYVQGAEVDWDALYGEGFEARRISLPTYPFDQQRCWINVESLEPRSSKSSGKAIHPLLEHVLADTWDQIIYTTDFSPKKHFVLHDHMIMGSYVLPGTTYIEMIVQAGKRLVPDAEVVIKDISFYKPLVMLDEDEKRQIQTIVKYKEDQYEFTIVSREEGGGHVSFKQWTKHAEGRFSTHHDSATGSYDIGALKDQCNSRVLPINQNELSKGFIEFGPRWLTFHKLWIGRTTALAKLSLPDEFLLDLDTYYIHPCMLDMAVAAYCFTFEKRYLPLSYKQIKLYGRMPSNFYSYIKQIRTGINDEVVSFDIDLMDGNGQVFANITDFSLKKVHEFKTLVRDNIMTSVKWNVEALVHKELPAPTGLTLILRDQDAASIRLAGRIKAIGGDVVEAELGAVYEQADSLLYRITGSKTDYDRLIQELKGRRLSRIVHLLTAGEASEIKSIGELDESLHRGLFSVYYLLQSLVSNGLKDHMALVFITRNACEVTGDERVLNPEHAATSGLCKVIAKEHSGIRCKFIDLDAETSDDVLLHEALSDSSDPNGVHIALRANERYFPQVELLNIEDLPNQAVEFKEEGVYVITGGSGGLGLVIAKHLASKKPMKLALIGRMDIPQRQEWTELIAFQNGSKQARLVERILEIESMGSKVLYCSADISSYEQTRIAMDKIRAEWGQIHGVIHAAGLAGRGYIFMKEEAELQKVIGPKIHGTLNLDLLTVQDDLDFMVFFSSVASILAYPGQGDYTAANAFLNAYSEWRNKQGRNTVSINWSAWRETGMAVDYGVDIDTMFKSISNAEALSAFDEVLNKKLSTVIIGQLDTEHIAETNGRGIVSASLLSKVQKRLKRVGLKPGITHENPQISIIDKDIGDLDEIQIQLAEIWAKVLGMREINLYEGFYEMGGDSILATKLFKELDREFPGMLDIADIFSYSSVSQLAAYLKQQIYTRSSAKVEPIEDVLDKLIKGEISINDADAVMRTGGTT